MEELYKQASSALEVAIQLDSHDSIAISSSSSLLSVEKAMGAYKEAIHFFSMCSCGGTSLLGD